MWIMVAIFSLMIIAPSHALTIQSGTWDDRNALGEPFFNLKGDNFEIVGGNEFSRITPGAWRRLLEAGHRVYLQ